MEEDGRRERLDIYTAIRTLADLYPEIVASMRISMNRREFTLEEWAGFIGEAASEVAGCLKCKRSPELNRSGQEFPHVVKALNDAMQEGEFTWERFILFLCGVQKILNELRFGKEEQHTTGGKVMSEDKDLGKAEVPVASTHEIVEARELSPMEVRFMAWAADRFDEAAWLKKHGLISPEMETANV